MDSQKRSFRGRTTFDIVSETERCKGWAAQNGQVGYEINSQREAHNETEPTPSHDQNNTVAARSHHRLPPGRPMPQKQLRPLVARGSTCNITENTPQAKMLIPSCRHFTENVRSALMFASPHPPVTASTLIELDLNWILHNINLRSDINFETDLHFMPVKGKRADQKRKEAQEYWLALAAELQVHLHARLGCPPSHENEESFTGESFTPRLGQMFTDLRELLETLVPDRDHASIAENLDVPFVMQQIENGVLDISRLAEWLASLMKSHCAPMRDEWADQMTQQIEEGAKISDMVLLVRGIEKLFSILEAMKLDVANHQIRTFRFQLMDDTVPFQQGFFAKRIMDGKIDSRSCRDWYDKAKQRHLSWLLRSSTPMSLEAHASLIQGIIATLFATPGACVLPRSFQFDLKRIERLRTDTQDLIHLRTGLVVFDELRFWLARGQPVSSFTNDYAELQSRLLAIVDEQPDDGDPWQTSIADVSLEITRAACTLCGHSEVVIPDRWIQSTFLRLTELLSRQTPESILIWESLQEQLTSRTIHHAQVFHEMTPLAVSEAQQQWQQQQEQKNTFRPPPDVEDIARRLAHVGILHWNIWANLVYLDDAKEAPSELLSVISLPSDT